VRRVRVATSTRYAIASRPQKQVLDQGEHDLRLGVVAVMYRVSTSRGQVEGDLVADARLTGVGRPLEYVDPSLEKASFQDGI
jgi:hypothetical protein